MRFCQMQRFPVSRMLPCAASLATILLGVVALLVLPSAAYSYSMYSGTSVGGDGTVLGWGVTNASFPNMWHTAYVRSTLQSPNGRRVDSGTLSNDNSVRADISLSYDGTDLGDYFVTSYSDGYCHRVNTYLFRYTFSGSEITVPYVVFTLRTSGTVSADNGGRASYIGYLGYDALGCFFSQGTDPKAWRTGVEIMGTVFPSFYTGMITIKRTIIDARWYNYNNANPVDSWSNVPDNTPDPFLRDDDPQSGYSSGKVYDLDAPFMASGSNNPMGFVWRRRVNFLQWATLPDGTPVSGNLYWYSRLSIIKQSGGDQKETTFSDDNLAGLGTTALSWNLQ